MLLFQNRASGKGPQHSETNAKGVGVYEAWGGASSPPGLLWFLMVGVQHGSKGIPKHHGAEIPTLASVLGTHRLAPSGSDKSSERGSAGGHAHLCQAGARLPLHHSGPHHHHPSTGFASTPFQDEKPELMRGYKATRSENGTSGFGLKGGTLPAGIRCPRWEGTDSHPPGQTWDWGMVGIGVRTVGHSHSGSLWTCLYSPPAPTSSLWTLGNSPDWKEKAATQESFHIQDSLLGDWKIPTHRLTDTFTQGTSGSCNLQSCVPICPQHERSTTAFGKREDKEGQSRDSTTDPQVTGPSRPAARESQGSSIWHGGSQSPSLAAQVADYSNCGNAEPSTL